MVKKINKIILLQFLIFLFVFDSNAKVDPPNYNFSLDMLRAFFPNQNIDQIKNQKTLMEQKEGIDLYRFEIKHVRYIFPVFVRAKGNIILDFFTRLPTYFLHDLFHQSLINRFGKQDLYKHHEKQAVYVWKNKNNIKLTYAAACTITCFPLYLSAGIANQNDKKSILNSMKENLLKTNSLK